MNRLAPNPTEAREEQLVFDWSQAIGHAQRIEGLYQRLVVVDDTIARVTPELDEARSLAGLDDLAAARRDRIKQLADDDDACQQVAAQIKAARATIRRTNPHQTLKAQRSARREILAEIASLSRDLARGIAGAAK